MVVTEVDCAAGEPDTVEIDQAAGELSVVDVDRSAGKTVMQPTCESAAQRTGFEAFQPAKVR